MRSVRERSIYGYHRSINALKPKFVIPVKTERSKLIVLYCIVLCCVVLCCVVLCCVVLCCDVM